MNRDKISIDVNEASRILLSGGIIGMPTETVYGLAACALDQSAVARVFAVKGRPVNHPLIVHLSPEADLSKWGVITPQARRLADVFWPGPLTLLVQRTGLVPDWVTGGRNTVALRVPSHPIAIELLRLVDTGVVAPSANKFGKVSPTDAQHVLHDLGEEIDFILDGGPCAIGVESTIVECVGESAVILRPGAITENEIRSALNMELESNNGDSRAPGMMASHYSPDADVILVNSLAEAQVLRSKMGEVEGSVSIVFHENNDEYARKLYDDLRAADRNGCSTVIAVLPSAEGVGTAVRDRLTKAANR